jgi:large subunit ribosomal protein L1
MPFLSLLLRHFSNTHAKTKRFSPQEALSLLREGISKPEIESFDIILRMGLDPTRNDHMVRGHVFYPAGTGKAKKIAVFIPEEHKAHALSLGASLAGDELLAQVSKGEINFEHALATTDMFDALKPHARTLGQRGLMPTLRGHTLIPIEELKTEIDKLKKGMVTYRLNKWSIIQAALGKVKFEDSGILLNLKAFISNLYDAKPKSFKQSYVKKAFLSTTYGKAYEINPQFLNPTHAKWIFRDM